MATKVKICGMTNLPDAEFAAEAGADALGFVFYERSPRAVSISAAAAISRRLPQYVVRVGVFVDSPEELVLRAIAECSLNLLQFHGGESPKYCTQFGVMSMKAFRIRDAGSLADLGRYGTDAWLLDAYVPDQVGGSGHQFNWELAVEAQKFGRPVFLAGGLTAANVGTAVRQVHPYAVDVSSGVEASPGRKDPAKVRAFIEAVRKAD
jgi:phosphoribosylanthranilate isomerase